MASSKPASIDAYIANFSPEVQAILYVMRSRAAAASLAENYVGLPWDWDAADRP